MRVWVVTVHSESGDNYGPYVFAKKPKNLKAFLMTQICCDEFDPEGPYEDYGYLGVQLVRVKLRD